MRCHIRFDCADALCIGTLDEADGKTGLLIVSGGNEIRSGAYGGQAALSAHFAALGYPTFRYDRRGIGDSTGENQEFESTNQDIAAALSAFRTAAPEMQRVVAFGNCDAATALAFFHADLPIEALVLANPWVIDAQKDNGGDNDTAMPSAAAIRARYWARIKNPRSIIDLLSGKINLLKLVSGLSRASKQEAPSDLAERLAASLTNVQIPTSLLIAKRDSTALAFADAWRRDMFAPARNAQNITLYELDSASHSFANSDDQSWLYRQIQGDLSKL